MKSNLPDAITFVDHNLEVVRQLSRYLGNLPECRFVQGDVLEQSGGTLVSPSNCYGDMGGGIDKEYAERFDGVEERLQDTIAHYHGGKLEIGKAVTIPTHDEQFPYIVCSPTVERPGDVATPENVYHASKALLLETVLFNDKIGRTGLDLPSIDELIVPGLGTGSGGLPPEQSAPQVGKGFLSVYNRLDDISTHPERYGGNHYS